MRLCFFTHVYEHCRIWQKHTMQLLKLFHYIVLLVIQKKRELLCFFFSPRQSRELRMQQQSPSLKQMDFVASLAIIAALVTHPRYTKATLFCSWKNWYAKFITIWNNCDKDGKLRLMLFIKWSDVWRYFMKRLKEELPALKSILAVQAVRMNIWKFKKLLNLLINFFLILINLRLNY